MDLTTTYLGLELRSPLVASAGPLAQTVTGVKALAAAGVGAVVLHSVFEEQVRAADERAVDMVEAHADVNPEARSYVAEVPGADDSLAPAKYLALLEGAAEAVDVPVIASLNGATLGGWTSFAKELESAGAAAIELNTYFVPGDLATPGADVERRHLEVVAAVKAAVSIPVAVKLSSAFSSVGNFCLQLDRSGADGLVLFNRFLQPDVDLDTLTVGRGFELSSPEEGRLPRTWIAALRGHVTASLAGSTGVATADDVVKYLLAGADVVMATAALVRNGPGFARELLAGVEEFATRRGFASLDEMRGLLATPEGMEGDRYARSGYVASLQKAARTYGPMA